MIFNKIVLKYLVEIPIIAMGIKKLELIAKLDGRWVRVSDSSPVDACQEGEQFVDIMAPFERVYGIVRRHAKQQDLWYDNIGYSYVTNDHFILENLTSGHVGRSPDSDKKYKLIAGQFYRIS